MNAFLRIVVCAGFLGTAFDAKAQTDPISWISAPLVGLLSQNKAEVRPILGVAGSSTIGDPIAMPTGTIRVYLAPGQQWALDQQQDANGVTLGFITFAGIHPSSVSAINGVISAPSLVSFSPTGRSAVLLSNATGILQVLTGLNGTPQVSVQVAISDLVAAGVQAVAVSDDGTLPVVLTNDGKVSLVSAGAPSQLIFQTGAPAGMSFLPNQQALAIADGSAATVTIMAGLTQLPFPSVVVSGPSLSGDRLFVQGSGDAKFVVVAAVGATTAYRIDLVNRSVQPLAVPTGVSELERLRGNDTFLFSANAGEAAWMLLADSVSLKASFAQSSVVGPRTPVGPDQAAVGAPPNRDR